MTNFTPVINVVTGRVANHARFILLINVCVRTLENVQTRLTDTSDSSARSPTNVRHFDLDSSFLSGLP